MKVAAARAYAVLHESFRPRKREDFRKLLHFAMTGFAIPLRWLTPLQAAVMASSAIVLNWVVMPTLKLDKGLRRQGDPYVDGIKLYPVAILAVLLLFPKHVAAAAWAVMGVGDAASNVVGRHFGSPGFLGRDDRSLLGSVAFLVTAWPAAWALAAFVGHLGLAKTCIPALCAACAGAAVELVPLPHRLDDNLPIALAAAGAFALAAH